ncbi:hypothetical protein BST61_g3477 [Cercospora zeina]
MAPDMSHVQIASAARQRTPAHDRIGFTFTCFSTVVCGPCTIGIKTDRRPPSKFLRTAFTSAARTAPA